MYKLCTGQFMYVIETLLCYITSEVYVGKGVQNLSSYSIGDLKNVCHVMVYNVFLIQEQGSC